MTKASDLFVQCLEEEGVEHVFGVPGEENLDFLDSLSRSTKIKPRAYWLTTRHAPSITRKLKARVSFSPVFTRSRVTSAR